MYFLLLQVIGVMAQGQLDRINGTLRVKKRLEDTNQWKKQYCLSTCLISYHLSFFFSFFLSHFFFVFIAIGSLDSLSLLMHDHPLDGSKLFFITIKVTVDLQGCLPKNHSHARLLCYSHRKVYIVVKLIKSRIRRINSFWI